MQKHKMCPFCGSIPEWEPWHGGRPTKILISCVNESCPVMPRVTGETPSEAAARWNTRVDVTPSTTLTGNDYRKK